MRQGFGYELVEDDFDVEPSEVDTVAAESFVRIGAIGATVGVAGQSLQGNVSIEGATDSSGADVVKIALAGAELALSDGTVDLVDVTSATGAFLVNAAGVAGTLEGTVSLGVTDFAFTTRASGSVCSMT